MQEKKLPFNNFFPGHCIFLLTNGNEFYMIAAMKKIDLSRFQDKFIRAVQAYLNMTHSTQKSLAKKVGLQESHLSYLMTGKRTLTCHYLLPFIQKGVLRMSDVHNGIALTDREREFLEIAYLIENTHLMQKLRKAESLGLDAEAWLDGYITSKQESK